MIRFLLGHGAAPVDINRPLTAVAAICIAVIGPEVFIVQPGFVQGMVAQLGFSEQQAGYVASAEMWGLALTTLLMSFISSRVNWRHALLVSVPLIVAGNLLSLVASEPGTFALWRFLTGLGCGVLVSLGFTIIGLTANPDRNFGYLIMAVLTYGAFGLWLMPTAFAHIGMDGVIVFFALFPLLALPLIRYLPVSGEEHLEVEGDAVTLPLGLRLLAIGTMFSYFLAQGAVWAYLFLVGLSGGVDEQGVANGLTLSQFLGIAGALVAAVVGSRYGRLAPLSLGLLAGIVPLAFLFGQFSVLQYAVVVCVYNFAWNMTHPYLLAAMASFDRGGRLVVHAVGAQMLGLAIGPALAAGLIGNADYSAVLQIGIVLFLLAWALILPPALLQRHRLASAP
jgi:predicted MFS family arabinose efflux permease